MFGHRQGIRNFHCVCNVLHCGFFGLFKSLGFFQTLADFFWNARFCGTLQKILKGCFIFGRDAFKEVDQRKRYKTFRTVG